MPPKINPSFSRQWGQIAALPYRVWSRGLGCVPEEQADVAFSRKGGGGVVSKYVPKVAGIF